MRERIFLVCCFCSFVVGLFSPTAHFWWQWLPLERQARPFHDRGMETRGSKRAKLLAAAARAAQPTPASRKTGKGPKGPRPALQQLSNLKELSSEERALDGAPQGELFEAVLLDRSELTAIDELESALAVVVPTLAEANLTAAWNVEFDAITLLRRLAAFHPEVLNSALLGQVIPGIVRSIRNLRSVLVRNAILLTGEMVQSSGDELARCYQPLLDGLALALLDACSGNMPKLIRRAAADALHLAVSSRPLLSLLAPALASRSTHRNKEVAEAAMVYAEKVLGALFLSSAAAAASSFSSSSSSVASSSVSSSSSLSLSSLSSSSGPSPPDMSLFDRILPSLHEGLNGKTAPTKAAARSICKLALRVLGQEQFESKVSDVGSLSPSQKSELKAAALKPDAGFKAASSKSKGESAMAARKAMIQAMRKKKANMLAQEQQQQKPHQDAVVVEE